MHYIVQNPEETPELSLEFNIVTELLNGSRVHSFAIYSIEELLLEKNSKLLTAAIPVGSLQFVTTWLNKYCSIPCINPVEIPQCLRAKEFLKREYSLVPYESIPQSGSYFIKDASSLKSYAGFGNKNTVNIDEKIKGHIFQVSEIVNVKSEFRVYVIDGAVENVCNYNGNPLLFPDAELIQKANSIYKCEKDYPRSYTMDVMVSDRGTGIIEIHPFISCGLYNTLWGDNLLYAYKDGIDYVKTFNTPPNARNDAQNASQ